MTDEDAPEVGICLWANQICEQPNHHGCKTCLAVEPTRPGRADALRVVPLQVNREHEDAPWGCSCGAEFGDGIDRRWHLMNETVKATLAYVIPPAVGEAL